MQGQKSLPWGEKSTGEEVAQAQGRHVHSRRHQMWWYSEWGMRGWSVLGSVLLMGSSVFIGLSSRIAG